MKSALWSSFAFSLLFGMTQVLHAQQWLVYTPTNSPLLTGLTDLAADSSGNVWMVSASSVHLRRTDGTWRVFRYDSAFVPAGPAAVKSLIVRRDSTVIVSADSGLFRFDGTQWVRLISRPRGGNHLTEDLVGRLWCTDSNLLVYYWDFTGSMNQIKREEAICGYFIAANGVQYLGDRSRVWRYDGVSFRPWPAPDQINCFAEMPLGTIWIGHNSGLSYIRNDSAFWAFAGSPPLPSNVVNALYASSEGRLWIGTPAGIAIFDGATWEFLNAGNSELPGNDVRTFAEDRFGNMWIGTTQGVAAYRNGGVVSVRAPAIPRAPALALWPTPAGRVINISMRGTRERAELMIFDYLGRLMGKTVLEQGSVSSMDVSALPTGSYVVRAVADGTIITRPFVKL